MAWTYAARILGVEVRRDVAHILTREEAEVVALECLVRADIVRREASHDRSSGDQDGHSPRTDSRPLPDSVADS